MKAECVQPSELTAKVRQRYGMDVEDFPEAIQTRFGQSIELRRGSVWQQELPIEHVGYRQVGFRWGKRFCRHPLLEWAFRAWSIERIQSRIDVRPCIQIGKALDTINVVGECSIRKLEGALAEWASETASKALASRRPELQIGLRLFIGWGVEEEIPGFTEYALNRALEVSLLKHGADHLVSILDREEGPFTFDELRAIEAKLESLEGLVEERAIYYLARDWGLRPVQIALLRTSDVDQDEVGAYVMVPSVKGVRRSAMRRHPSNMKKRYISPETHNALLNAAAKARESADEIKGHLVASGICSEGFAASLPTPFFPATRPSGRSRTIAGDKAIAEYLLHSDSSLISQKIRRLTQILGISLPRPGGHSELLEIGLLRLRRTKGTSMVLNGATPEEVAEVLDHETTQTVSHYFLLNRDVIEYIDAAQSSSTDVRAAAEAWAGRLISQESAAAPNKIRVGSLGLCSLGRPCPHHPTVTCYACQKFEPFLEGNHQRAKAEMLELRSLVADGGTGPVAKQIDVAIQAADAVMLAIAEMEVPT